MRPQEYDLKQFLLNFGPQHPATHGVLRLVFGLDGEYIDFLLIFIGFLHRGTEKLCEVKNFLQIIPYLDRLDYVSTICYEHTFSLLIEKILNLKLDTHTSIIRVLLLELTRILNHILAITTQAIDLGAATPFLWGFEEREKLMECLELISGARLHTAIISPGGFLKKVPLFFFDKIKLLLPQLWNFFHEVKDLLLGNRIWQQRLISVGIISADEAINWSFSGVLLRACGLAWDLRMKEPYEYYNNLTSFRVAVGTTGDCFTRFLIRLFEIKNSLLLVEESINHFFSIKGVASSSVTSEDYAYSMDYLIEHFLLQSEGDRLSFSSKYLATECPKGEFGIFLLNENNFTPSRLRLRAPGFFHLQALRALSRGSQISDLVAVLGSIDLVLGEVDR